MKNGLKRSLSLRCALGSAALTFAGFSGAPALAQEVSENRAWQFDTPQEIAAGTAAADLIARQRAGIYAAPVYSQTIARQYPCPVAASATGNSDAQSAVANSSAVTGTTLRVRNAGQSSLGSTGSSVAATATGNIATNIVGPR